ncbi:HNH endonuclease [Chamaesiphon sp. VAR_48_metabat_135_sub]|uniref:HNH endonuclease n=1 Tax=Chamaesiphon sp. VAR_48_metabat_135_sub TaxID=2964699 RepID=UPI00286B267F|nr:HNH endonuclease [Chamaesiphon sp. VAR_48_metabat_135_sub]
MREKSKRISFPKEVREYVFQRDNHQCQSCGQTTKLSIDHIIPLATGGTNDISNLQTLCGSCNSAKKHYFDARFDRHFSSS